MSNKYWTDKKDGTDVASVQPINEAFDGIATDIESVTKQAEDTAQQVAVVSAETKEFENKSVGMFANAVTETKTSTVVNIDNSPPYETPIDCSVSNIASGSTGDLIVVGTNLIPTPYEFFGGNNTYTESGITFTMNDNGSITADGKSTAAIKIPLILQGSMLDKLLVPGQRYYFLGARNARTTSEITVDIHYTDSDGNQVLSKKGLTNFIVPENFQYAEIWINIKSGTSITGTSSSGKFRPLLYLYPEGTKTLSYNDYDVAKFSATYYMFDTATGKTLETVKSKLPYCTVITANSEKVTATYVKDTSELKAISTDNIESSAVTTDKIADSAVTTDKIADRSISSDKTAMGEINHVLRTDLSGYQKVWRADEDNAAAEKRIMSQKCYALGENCFAGCGVFNISDISDDGLTLQIHCHDYVPIEAGCDISYKDVTTPYTALDAATITKILSMPAPSSWEIQVNKPFPQTATFAFFLEHPEWGFPFMDCTKNAVAFGNSNKALGENSVSFGNGNMAYGENSLTAGTENKAAWSSVAMGGWNEATGSLSTAMGSANKATGIRSLAIGYYNEATANNSVALGNHTKTYISDQMVVGRFNAADRSSLFVVGAGNYNASTGEVTRKNAMTVSGSATIFNNTVYVNKLSGHDGKGISIYQGNATARGSLAVGNGATASRDYSGAFGQNSLASGYSSFAANWGTASTDFSFAANWGTASGLYSSALGYGTNAKGKYSTAVGYYSTTNGAFSLSSGTRTQANGENSVTQGNNTIANGKNSIACGDSTNANGENSIALGAESKTFSSDCISGGYSSYAGCGVFNVLEVTGKTIKLDSVTGLQEGYEVSYYYNTTDGLTEANAAIIKNVGTDTITVDTTVEGTPHHIFVVDHPEIGHADTLETHDCALAFGTLNKASGYDSTAFGSINKAVHSNSFVTGYMNESSAENQTVMGTYAHGNKDALFIVGNGNSKTFSDSNAFEVRKDGTLFAKSIILTSPSGKCFEIGVDDNGNITTTRVTYDGTEIAEID